MRRLIPTIVLLTAACSSAPDPNLESGDPYERYLGALEAVEDGDDAAMPRIVAQLKDPEPLARIGAIVAIAQARREGALPLITEKLVDADPDVRTQAVRAVAEFRDPGSVGSLANVLLNDRAEAPRRTAARVLGAYGDLPLVRASLLQAFSDPSAGVAYNAFRSLSEATGRTDLPRDRAAAEEALKRS